MEELQQDQIKLGQTIGNIHHHMMSPTTPPPPVVVGTSTTISSCACNQPRNSVLVGCDEESGTPVGLCQHPCNDVTGLDDKMLGTTHVPYPPPCNTVSSGRKSGLVAQEFMSFSCSDGTSAPLDLGTTATDICSNSHHPLFPQVDPLTFNNLAERGCMQVNNDYAHDGMTATTTQVGTTTNTTCLDKSHSPFCSS
jgi:hypothetical protein